MAYWMLWVYLGFSRILQKQMYIYKALVSVPDPQAKRRDGLGDSLTIV